MSIKTKEIVDNPNMIVTADKGYYSTKEIKKYIEDSYRDNNTTKMHSSKQKNKKWKICKKTFYI